MLFLTIPSLAFKMFYFLPHKKNVAALWINSLILDQLLFSDLWHSVKKKKNPKAARSLVTDVSTRGSNSKGLWLQRVREDLSQWNKKCGCFRHRKWQKGPETQKWMCGDQCLLRVVFSDFLHSSATIQTPIFIPLFCACDPTLILSWMTSSPTTMPLYSKLLFGKLEDEYVYDWRVLWADLHFAVTEHSSPLSRKLKSVIRSLSFDVGPTFRQVLSTIWPPAGTGLHRP